MVRKLVLGTYCEHISHTSLTSHTSSLNLHLPHASAPRGSEDCTVRLKDRSVRTHVVKRNLNPTWGRRFYFWLPEDDYEAKVTFFVLDKVSGRGVGDSELLVGSSSVRIHYMSIGGTLMCVCVCVCV